MSVEFRLKVWPTSRFGSSDSLADTAKPLRV